MTVKVKLVKTNGTVTTLQVEEDDVEGESLLAHKGTVYRFKDSHASNNETEWTYVETEDPFKK